MEQLALPYELLEELAFTAGGDARPAYSGRNMYGAVCAGIVLPCTTDLINLGGAIQELHTSGKLQGELHAELTSGASIDDMGRSLIVYWPNIGVED